METAPVSDIDSARWELIDGPPSNNYVKRQIQLAVEKFRTEKPWEHVDKAKLDEILHEWSSKEPNSDSRKFAAIVEHPNFKDHPKYRGDVANITLEDMYQ